MGSDGEPLDWPIQSRSEEPFGEASMAGPLVGWSESARDYDGLLGHQYAGRLFVGGLAMDKANHTRMFSSAESSTPDIGSILKEVSAALVEKGYEPMDQLVGFLVSGDPSYITSHRNARTLLSQLERDDVLEEVVQFYLDHLDNETR